MRVLPPRDRATVVFVPAAFLSLLYVFPAVAWLARKVAGFGVRLEAGHVILPGSCTRAIDVRPGDDFHADFKGLGSVSLTFGSGPTEPVSDAGSDS